MREKYTGFPGTDTECTPQRPVKLQNGDMWVVATKDHIICEQVDKFATHPGHDTQLSLAGPTNVNSEIKPAIRFLFHAHTKGVLSFKYEYVFFFMLDNADFEDIAAEALFALQQSMSWITWIRLWSWSLYYTSLNSRVWLELCKQNKQSDIPKNVHSIWTSGLNWCCRRQIAVVLMQCVDPYFLQRICNQS